MSNIGKPADAPTPKAPVITGKLPSEDVAILVDALPRLLVGHSAGGGYARNGSVDRIDSIGELLHSFGSL